MTDISSFFPSKFLKAGDLSGDLTATIVGVETQVVGDADRKPILHFHEAELKPLVLNRVNAAAICAVLGSSDVREWVGRRITMYATHTEFAGRRVPCIRIRDRAPQPQQRRPAPPMTEYQRPLDRDEPPLDEGRWEREV